MLVKAKTAMICFGQDRKPGEEFDMPESDAQAHKVAGLVEIVEVKAEVKSEAKPDPKADPKK